MGFWTLLVWMLVLYVAAYHMAMFTVGRYVNRYAEYTDFIRALLWDVYCLSAVVLLSWFVYGQQSLTFITFALAYVATLARIDYDSLGEDYKEIRDL